MIGGGPPAVKMGYDGGMTARSGTAAAGLGIFLALVGLGALAEIAWFWRIHTALGEASVGNTPRPSAFLNLLNAQTEAEREHWKREVDREDREAIEEGRRDILRLSVRLYAILPSGRDS